MSLGSGEGGRCLRLGLASVVAVLTLGLSACDPIGKVVDNPKDGDVLELVQDQPLQFRMTNQEGLAWRLESGAAKVLKPVNQTGRPAEAGALELALYDFVAAAPGTDTLTFTYGPKGAAPTPTDERTTVTIRVE